MAPVTRSSRLSSSKRTPKASTNASSKPRAGSTATPKAAGKDKSDGVPFTTPDRRYIIVKGVLWRKTNPNLPEEERQKLVNDLMAARRDVGVFGRAGDKSSVAAARVRVDQAKRALGERGPTWWDDGTDYNRKKVENTPYKDWYAGEVG